MSGKNMKNKTLERGALMLEALAMLGLIAVVTPTMYKKSAERTLEVEDINTADTVRTYTKAVEAYMSENMSTIMANFEDGGANIDGNVMTVDAGNLSAYLPYKFDVTKTLYDYQLPKIRIYKNGTSLTSFILFPAKGDADNGVGQERTSRIAALIGSSGGYVTGSHKARGVGGVWSLDETAYGEIFEGDNSNTYSLVTVSSNVVSGNSDAGLDNSKYLQRTYEGAEQEWRNTMRTDLYLGGFTDQSDDFPTDYPEGSTLHSIRNIDSLIVGARTAGGGETDVEGDYGLYINSGDGSKPNAFITGTLTAAASQFFVGPSEMKYGIGGEADEEGNVPYNFQIDNNGNITNVGNLNLATNFNNEGVVGSINIGGNGDEASINVLRAQKEADSDVVNASLLNKDILTLQTDGYAEKNNWKNADNEKYDANVKIMTEGYKKISSKKENEEGYEYLGATNIGAEYKDRNRFPVEVGSNMLVDGVLAAGQIDAQKLRLAELSAGSANIDDAEKWLKVDQNGVLIHSSKAAGNDESTTIRADKDRIVLRKGFGGKNDGTVADTSIYTKLEEISNETDGLDNIGAFIELAEKKEEDEKSRLTMGGANVDILGNNKVELRTGGMRAKMTQDELLINGSDMLGEDVGNDEKNNHRTVFENGHVEMVGANLRVINDNEKNILSIKGNNAQEENYEANYNDKFFDDNTETDMTVHGNVTFTSIMDDFGDTYSDGEGGAGSGTNKWISYMTIGNRDNTAAVNIVKGNASANNQDSYKQMLVLDMEDKPGAHTQYENVGTEEEPNYVPVVSSNTKYTLDPGTIYVRKGLLDIVPSKGENGKDADSGTGIIRAGRFVAHNVRSDGSEVKVPQLIKEDIYAIYNGLDIGGRYDTYMVNPAYTSVMNDIKLVSRGGARLSDIMPDFITKGIYLVKNDYDDTLSSLNFELRGDGKEVIGANKTDDISWASPYSGVVPMPQCPPGYARVITTTPSGFQMGQAGSMAFTEWNGKKSLYVPEKNLNTEHLDDALDDHDKLADYLPEYQQPQIDLDASLNNTITLTDPENNRRDYTVDDIRGLKIDYPFNREGSDIVDRMYKTLMAADDNALLPLAFQQNTFLKALQVKVRKDDQNKFGNEDGDLINNGTADPAKYWQAWAILLGYIYPKDVYKNFAQKAGFGDHSHDVTESENSYYWNIFPILKTSIEATVTTYCYFDRTNKVKHFSDDYYKNIHNYTLDVEDANFVIPTGYEKDADEEYWKNLNDPSMKYNEKW